MVSFRVVWARRVCVLCACGMQGWAQPWGSPAQRRCLSIERLSAQEGWSKGPMVGTPTGSFCSFQMKHGAWE